MCVRICIVSCIQGQVYIQELAVKLQRLTLTATAQHGYIAGILAGNIPNTGIKAGGKQATIADIGHSRLMITIHGIDKRLHSIAAIRAHTDKISQGAIGHIQLLCALCRRKNNRIGIFIGQNAGHFHIERATLLNRSILGALCGKCHTIHAIFRSEIVTNGDPAIHDQGCSHELDAADLTVDCHFRIGFRVLCHIVQHIARICRLARIYLEIVLRCRTVIQHVLHKGLDLRRVLAFQDVLRILPDAIGDGFAFCAIHHQLQGDVLRHLGGCHRYREEIESLGIGLLLGKIVGFCLTVNGDLYHRHFPNGLGQLHIEVCADAVAQDHIPLSDLGRQDRNVICGGGGAHREAHGAALVAQLVLISGLDGCVHIKDAGGLIVAGRLMPAMGIHS